MRAVSLLVILLVLFAGAVFTLTGQGTNRPAVYTAAQAEAGQREIQTNLFGNCTVCHTRALTGRKGDGDVNELPPLSSLPEENRQLIINYGGRVPPLVGPAFISRWGTRTTKDLNKEFVDRFSPSLTDETRLNIIAYLLQSSGALPGTEPLTITTDVQIGRLVPIEPAKQ